MKNLVILICILIGINLQAQEYWFKTIPSDNHQRPESDILIVDNHYYFSILEEYGPPFYQEYYTAFYKISSDGDINYSGIFNGNNLNLLGTIQQLDNGNLIGMGQIYLPEFDNYFSFYTIEFTKNLELINEKIDTINMNFGTHMNSFIKPNGQIYFHAMTSHDPFIFGQDYVYLRRMDQNISIIKDTLIQEGSYDIAPNILNDNIYIQSRGLDQNSGAAFIQINELDTNFQFINTPLSFNPDSLRYYFSIHLSQDSNYYFSAMRLREGSSWVDSHAAAKASKNMNQLYYRDFDTIGHVFYTPSLNGIDSYDQFVYTGGSLDCEGMQSPYPNYFSLTQMDTTFNIINQRFYGGDKNYWLTTIKTTPEGDVLLLGHCSELGTDLWNVFIMKVDQNGLITSTHEEESIPIKNAIALPNPGRDYLELHTGLYPSTLQLFNLKGNLILEEAIDSESTRINTQALPSGTYIWSLIKEGELVESDKWVKE